MNEICDNNHLLHDNFPGDDQALENVLRRVDSSHESDTESDSNLYEVRNDNDCSLNNSSDNDSSIDESDDDFNESDNNNFLNQVMFEASNMTVLDIILMVNAFSLRFHLSDEAKLELIKMIKLFAGENFKH